MKLERMRFSGLLLVALGALLGYLAATNKVTSLLRPQVERADAPGNGQQVTGVGLGEFLRPDSPALQNPGEPVSVLPGGNPDKGGQRASLVKFSGVLSLIHLLVGQTLAGKLPLRAI